MSRPSRRAVVIAASLTLGLSSMAPNAHASRGSDADDDSDGLLPGLLDGVSDVLDGLPGLLDHLPRLDELPFLDDGVPGLDDGVPGLLEDGVPGLLDDGLPLPGDELGEVGGLPVDPLGLLGDLPSPLDLGILLDIGLSGNITLL